MSQQMIVFDIDGVLVDPSETFRRALIETVRHFTGQSISQDDIVRIKNGGGFNDDSDLALHLIEKTGMQVSLQDIRDYGRQLYWGEDGDGLIRNERWLPREGQLERFQQNWQLGIFTGRGIPSTNYTLNRFCPAVKFDPIITHERVAKRKPAPDGLLEIKREVPDITITFIGDNIDDCKAAMSAGVRFIGIVSPGTPRHEESCRLFGELGAEVVVPSVNDLEDSL